MKGHRARTVTTLKAGLVIQPKERVRIVSGSAGKKSQGKPPEENEVRNFYLFMKVPYLTKPGSLFRLVTKQGVEVCQAAVE